MHEIIILFGVYPQLFLPPRCCDFLNARVERPKRWRKRFRMESGFAKPLRLAMRSRGSRVSARSCFAFLNLCAVSSSATEGRPNCLKRISSRRRETPNRSATSAGEIPDNACCSISTSARSTSEVAGAMGADEPRTTSEAVRKGSVSILGWRTPSIMASKTVAAA